MNSKIIVTVINLVCFALIFTSFIFNSESAEQIKNDHFNNLHKVNNSLYRSEKCSKRGLEQLQSLGIKSIINLRIKKEKAIISKLLLTANYPIKTKKMSYSDIVNVLQLIEKADKPCLLHCLHGSDRTGIIIAAYRMAYDNWSKKRAIEEFTNEQFGYHEGLFPELLSLLQELNINKLKSDIEILKSEQP